ncbi:restriction endonuclease subunit S [Bacteroides sp. OF04-15BH]|uniref:restriction endonuclease subunit S n=1 Tax=Bacteroides sp. OF04-15BH TaxID=2292281 RepID=UPI000E4EB0E0|nr:restriction endonuclease subunit S [Bacteroides sp. OF04-15BH]RHP63630.1 restriction endonuclease subunit S [Bacteroides sp. OF04-15BH]
MSANDNVKWVRLGDYIELCDERNSDGKYAVDDVRGISTDKKFIPTKANMDGVSLSSYKIVNNREFAYVADTSRRGDKIALALNTTSSILISSIYTTFKSKDNKELLPEYLFLLLSRSEFDRYARFNSWGSARETFDWSELCRVEIPLPDINIQKELVDIYNGLKALAEQNEALIEPLSKACEAFIVDCKAKYPEVILGEYIEELTEKNKDNLYSKVLGLSTQKEFREPNSRVNKEELTNYKLVPNNCFAYVPTTDTWKVFACALNKEETIVVSPIYCVFKINNSNLLSEYLNVLFKPAEFDRYVRFNSWGSARENFNFGELCNVRIALPPIKNQQSVINLYNCLEEAKKIASEARDKLKELCPALIQRAANS